MSSLDKPLSAVELVELVPAIAVSRWDRFESLLVRLSERLNPILVKEARQALKSKQFTTTFFLMLIGGWAWSILGLAIIGPNVQYSAEGPGMFFVYYIILAFPLLVVAPYSAFHSLASERQDRTYELVSITALNARQILSGKLGSIMMQMLIYLSAIFPCLAFTYLLRGLDIFTIIMVVTYTCCLSLGASVLGLLLATMSPARQRSIVGAVLFAMLLFGHYIITMVWMVSMIASDGFAVGNSEFWLINLAFLTFYVNYFALVFLAARSQLTTVCQNRSTALRVALTLAQLSWLGWMAWPQMRIGGHYMSGFLFFTTVFWYVAGVFITGESSVLSPRIRRDLPQTLLGRVFLTWFTPGPGTGYTFVIVNVLVAALMANFPYPGFAAMFGIQTPVSVVTRTPASFVDVAVVTTSYVIIFLGIGKLLLDVIARFSEVRLTTRVMVHACLLLLASGIPFSIQMSVPSLRRQHYTLLQITNPIWTVWESCNKVVPETEVLTMVLPMVALIVWLANLPSIAAELEQVRAPRPARVEEEDEALAAAAKPAGPTSPWD